MTKLGYALSSEEHSPQKLISLAHEAELAGFSFACISDHYHPWVEQQGQSPFVWSVLGGIAQVTKTLEVGTGVTCPILRIHPAVIAQAAATAACLLNGRFFLGIGTGENLNEHIVGEGWPPIHIRHEMIIEAIEIIKLLWQGETRNYDGVYFTVESAKIYSLPEQTPRLMMAASGSISAGIAGRNCDGLINTAPDPKVIDSFNKSGGSNKPRYGQLTVCYAKNETEAVQSAKKWWPNAALKGNLSQEIRTPKDFESATAAITDEQVQQEIICGPDPQKHLDGIKKYIDAGFDHIYIHQVGDNQSDFFSFYKNEIIPKFS